MGVLCLKVLASWLSYRPRPEESWLAGRGEPVLPRSTWEPMGGCPGHRELSGQAAGVVRPPSSEAFIGRSMAQEHGRLLRRASVTQRARHDLHQATRQPFHQTSPRGVGVYGEFDGTEDGSGCEVTCCHPHLQTRTEPSCCPFRTHYCSRAHDSARIATDSNDGQAVLASNCGCPSFLNPGEGVRYGPDLHQLPAGR
jgi:hypothetical protein